MNTMAEAGDRLFPGKFFISTVLDALETKAAMTSHQRRRYLQRSGMAGMIVAIFYATNYSIVVAFQDVKIGDGSLVSLGRMAGALAFGWALVFIYYTKSELLTSNMMVVTIGMYHKRIGVGRAMGLLAWCYIGNLLGGLVMALIFRFSTVTTGAVGEVMAASVEHKLAYVTSGPTGIVDLLMRAILCNFLINLAMLLIYNGFIKEDITKAAAMITAVFIFAFLGFEHSVANTVLFTMVGLREGIDWLAAAGNVGVALVGNYIGGGLLIGLYYAYVNDDHSFRVSADSSHE